MESLDRHIGVSALALRGVVKCVSLRSCVSVLCHNDCFFLVLSRFVKVSMELVVRVLTVVLSWCPAMKRHAYMRSLERRAALLTSRGHITGVEVSKPSARVFCQEESRNILRCSEV